MKIELTHHALNQYQIMVNDHRVGYLATGKHPSGGEMPINWLPKDNSGVEITPEERLAIGKEARAQMASINEKEAATEAALQQVTTGQTEESNGTDEGSDS